jgi:hypothetical protein
MDSRSAADASALLLFRAAPKRVNAESSLELTFAEQSAKHMDN